MNNNAKTPHAHDRVTADALERKQTSDLSRSFLAQVSFCFVHLLLGSIGVAAATACALYTTQEALHPLLPSFDHNRAARLLLTVPGYPLQALNGFALGFLMAKRLGGWISQFTWVVFFALVVLVWLHEPGRSVFLEHLRFDGTCAPGGSCFAKAIATLMLVSSTSYSLGAAVRGRKGLSKT